MIRTMGMFCIAIACQKIESRAINFTLQNNLRVAVTYAPLGTRNKSPHQKDLGTGNRILPARSVKIASLSNGGTIKEMVETDQFPRLLFKIENDPQLYLYEFNAQPYEEITLTLEKGGKLSPRFVPMGNNIKKRDITLLPYDDSASEDVQKFIELAEKKQASCKPPHRGWFFDT